MGGGDVLTQESAAAHVGDLASLRDVAERHGFRVASPAASDLFRKPDALRRAVRG